MELNFLTLIFSLGMMIMLAGTISLTGFATGHKPFKTKIMERKKQYTGMWVTLDGHIRQELLPDGRYNEARGTKKSAHTGKYQISGNRIKYRDDSGFTATGDFNGSDKLYHGGYIFYRDNSHPLEEHHYLA